MKFPKDPLDATIVAFLWADWFAKQCLMIPMTLYTKYDHWSHNKAVEFQSTSGESYLIERALYLIWTEDLVEKL